MNKEKNSNKCPICERPTHKESKYCIFHASAEEKTEKEFKQALKEYILKIKNEDKDYDFKRFIFVGDIEFKKDLGIAIFKVTIFQGAIFKGYANFAGVTFERSANFKNVTFKSDAYFRDAIFQGSAWFNTTIFERYANFKNVTFKGYAIFLGVTFKGDAGYWNMPFEIVGDFYQFFQGYVLFEDVTFKGYSIFRNVTFKGDAIFKIKSFAKTLDFSEISILSGQKLNLKSENKRGHISFERAHLENSYLDIELVEGILIDFTDALLKNTKFGRDQIENHILQEKYKNFTQAKKVFLLLKNNFHSIGQYEDESWAFKKEKDMERLSYSIESFSKNVESEEKKSKGKVPKEKKSKVILYFNWLKTKNFRKWLWSCFCNIIYGYGERPQNVLFSAIFIIILFSVFFSLLGINSPEIIEMKSPTVQEIFNDNSEIISKGNLINKTTNHSIDCLYFSAITFTTLGYGDFRPLEGLGRILAGSEAFIGAFTMALFVYTFRYYF